MDELLKKLLAADILTEETKTEIESEFKKRIDKIDEAVEEAVVQAKAETQAAVTAQLNEQWIKEREILMEALDTKVSESLEHELNELREDISRFRDLEIEYANNLVEAKESMAKTLTRDMSQLIEKLDAFLEIRLATELDELREDIEIVKKNEFGRNIFEAFVNEFKQHYAEDNSVESRLAETEMKLDEAMTALTSANRKAAKLERSMKLEKVLTPLTGRTKEVMEAILKNVDTNLIEEAYQTYIGRVLKETTDTTQTSEKETTVLAEGEKKTKVMGVTKHGNNDDQLIIEQQQHYQERSSTIDTAELERLRRVAGIK